MREKTVCFTGHRVIDKKEIRRLRKKLELCVTEAIESGYKYFGAGGALGFDTLAAQTVLNLREKYSHIKLILVLPCLSQADSWNDSDKRMYEYIKEQADKVVYTSQEYARGCMHKRNRHLVDNSSLCICYLTGDRGGTAYTVKYAMDKGLQTINLK